jgi:hypothetical protein
MNAGTKPSNADLKAIFCALFALVIAFHVGSALRGHGHRRLQRHRHAHD